MPENVTTRNMTNIPYYSFRLFYKFYIKQEKHLSFFTDTKPYPDRSTCRKFILFLKIFILTLNAKTSTTSNETNIHHNFKFVSMRISVLILYTKTHVLNLKKAPVKLSYTIQLKCFLLFKSTNSKVVSLFPSLPVSLL